jgi:membrane dipeptidase
MGQVRSSITSSARCDEEQVVNEGRQLYERALIWDAHSGFAPSVGADLNALSQWRNAGVGFLSVNVGYDVMPWGDTLRTLAAFRRWIAASDDYALVARARDIEAVHREGRMAVAFDIEGALAMGGALDMVPLYHDLGVRQMLLAYNRGNEAAGGCHDRDVGLSQFGRQVVAEMNRVGMVVDCSHCSFRTTMDVMECSTAPVVFSHSNARSLSDHQRNIVDEQARACAATGGVVGLAGYQLFLGGGRPTVDKLADHIDYFCDLVGPAHVGLGLDFDWAPDDAESVALFATMRDYWPAEQYPEGPALFLGPESLPELADVLVQRRYDERDVRAILGENFLRVASEVWG